MSITTNLKIDQGSNTNISFNLVDINDDPVDLSDMSSRASFKRSYISNTKYDIPSIVNVETGSITLVIDGELTSNVSANQYVYNVELISSSNSVTRIVEGLFTISP